ncbi:MAG: ferritin [Pirellulales bacterium]|nr:ferritin [Pirellulales bacterium]
MLSPRMQAALNKQVNAELFSSYLYLSMSAYFESTSMAGMAQWVRIQAQEELGHAMKFYDYINERNGRVALAQIESPKTEWKSPLDVFEDIYAHEQKVTALIHGLVDLAIAEKDHATETFLQWFVTEQVEEESAAATLVDRLKLVGDNGVAHFMLDGQLGQRAPTPAAGE